MNRTSKEKKKKIMSKHLKWFEEGKTQATMGFLVNKMLLLSIWACSWDWLREKKKKTIPLVICTVLNWIDARIRNNRLVFSRLKPINFFHSVLSYFFVDAFFRLFKTNSMLNALKLFNLQSIRWWKRFWCFFFFFRKKEEERNVQKKIPRLNNNKFVEDRYECDSKKWERNRCLDD